MPGANFTMRQQAVVQTTNLCQGLTIFYDSLFDHKSAETEDSRLGSEYEAVVTAANLDFEVMIAHDIMKMRDLLTQAV